MAKKKQRRKQEIPADESKSDRFVRVVTPRVSKAIKAIDVIGFCSGNAYDYTPKQIGEIRDALLCHIAELEKKFTSSKQSDASFGFTG